MNELCMEDIEKRTLEIEEELKGGSADVEALESEVAELEERKAEILRQTEERKKEIESIEKTAVEFKTFEKNEGVKSMDLKELRNSKEYLDAYANYVRTGNPSECRALLTENGGGELPVPELVYNVVKNAWNREGIMALVRKTYLKGNLKIAFELMGDEAQYHWEGEEVSEESLVLGTVTLIPGAIKKWISISDEALDMDSGAYLEYIYDELTYKIAKKCADVLVSEIMNADTVSTTTAVGVPALAVTEIGVGTIAQAMALLSDNASNPTVIMNKLTWGEFKKAQYEANFPVDPFEGCEVRYNDNLKAFNVASTGDVIAIVGDLGEGALANFPNGDEITIKRDDYTLATSDLVRFIGREYVALGVIAPDHFVNIKFGA